MDDAAIQPGGLPSEGGPKLVAEWVVDDAGNRFVVQIAPRWIGNLQLSNPPSTPHADVRCSFLQGDGDAAMRNAISEIDGAIDGVNHPAIFRVLIAQRSFFAENRE